MSRTYKAVIRKLNKAEKHLKKSRSLLLTATKQLRLGHISELSLSLLDATAERLRETKAEARRQYTKEVANECDKG